VLALALLPPQHKLGYVWLTSEVRVVSSQLQVLTSALTWIEQPVYYYKGFSMDKFEPITGKTGLECGHNLHAF